MSRSDSRSNNPVPLAIHAQKYLSGIDYPATRSRLVETARREGAEDAVIEALEGLDDREYASPIEISAQLGG